MAEVIACYASDLTYLDPNTQGPVRGRDAMRHYRFVSWVTWSDGSYGVLFHDRQPKLSVTGMYSGGHGRGLMLSSNNRSLLRAIGRPTPERHIVIREGPYAPSDLSMDFDCQQPLESFALYDTQRSE